MCPVQVLAFTRFLDFVKPYDLVMSPQCYASSRVVGVDAFQSGSWIITDQSGSMSETSSNIFLMLSLMTLIPYCHRQGLG